LNRESEEAKDNKIEKKTKEREKEKEREREMLCDEESTLKLNET
jgi:hypothetical protein